jgi:hypothetical protein
VISRRIKTPQMNFAEKKSDVHRPNHLGSRFESLQAIEQDDTLHSRNHFAGVASHYDHSFTNTLIFANRKHPMTVR